MDIHSKTPLLACPRGCLGLLNSVHLPHCLIFFNVLLSKRHIFYDHDTLLACVFRLNHAALINVWLRHLGLVHLTACQGLLSVVEQQNLQVVELFFLVLDKALQLLLGNVLKLPLVNHEFHTLLNCIDIKWFRSNVI